MGKEGNTGRRDECQKEGRGFRVKDGVNSRESEAGKREAYLPYLSGSILVHVRPKLVNGRRQNVPSTTKQSSQGSPHISRNKAHREALTSLETRLTGKPSHL